MHTTLTWASKGGSGKTTTVANVGAALAVAGYDVILVGLDPDGDLEQLYGLDPDDTEIVRVEQLLADPSLSPLDAAVRVPLGRGAKGKLRILASTQRLETAALPLAAKDYRDVRRILDPFEHDGADLALIDVPGARGPFVTAGARAADSILLPVQPGDFERSAVLRALTQVAGDAGYPLPPLGVLFCVTNDRSRDLRKHREAFAADGIPVFDRHIRAAAQIRRDPSRGGPSVLTSRRSDVAKDYKAVSRDIVDRIVELAEEASA